MTAGHVITNSGVKGRLNNKQSYTVYRSPAIATPHYSTSSRTPQSTPSRPVYTVVNLATCWKVNKCSMWKIATPLSGQVGAGVRRIWKYIGIPGASRGYIFAGHHSQLGGRVHSGWPASSQVRLLARLLGRVTTKGWNEEICNVSRRRIPSWLYNG